MQEDRIEKMPMAAAHAIMGAAIVTTMRAGSIGVSKKMIVLGALLAVCPDFDVLLLWGLGLDESLHRGFSHSIVFGTALGLLTWLMMGAANKIDAFMYVLAALSHTASDSLFSVGRDPIQLLWPFSSRRFNLGIFPYMTFPLDLQTLSSWVMLKQFVEYSLVEVLVFSPLLLFSYMVWKSTSLKAR
jgi:membrane-bound metal-dependent hydrolase YbcI (DUF457 family)